MIQRTIGSESLQSASAPNFPFPTMNTIRAFFLLAALVPLTNIANAQLRATYTVQLESSYFWTNDGDASRSFFL